MALLGFYVNSLKFGLAVTDVVIAIQYNGHAVVYMMSDTNGGIGNTKFQTFLPVTIHDDNLLLSLQTRFVEFSMKGGIALRHSRQRMIFKVKDHSGSHYIYEEEMDVEGDGLVLSDIEINGAPTQVKKRGRKKVLPWSAEYWDELLLSPDCRFRRHDPCKP